MGKGSSKGHTPREAKDNLKSTQLLSVIDAISEGPVEGPVDGLKSVLLNSTPVLDTEGNTNISGVTVVFRAGEQEQTPPEGFESSGSETVLGTEVKYDTPITRTITSANIDRLRFTFGVQALVETTSKGDRNPSEVRLLVQIQRNGGWVTEKDITIKGKTTSQYLASVVVGSLPPRPFNIRMRRMTPDSVEVQSVTDGLKVKVNRVPDGVAEYSVWGLKLPTLRQRLFRCVSIRENDDGTYAITAVQHVPEKEAIVDNGAHFDGDQSGTVNGVTLPAVQHLTAEVTADSGEYQVLARWDTPKVVKGVSFLLRLTVTADDGSERLVSTARTTETTYRFTQLALGNYRLTVRAVNAWGQQGDPASVSFRIAAPAAPSRIELTPGYFQITATPHLAVYDPTVQFEFWFSEKRITDIRQVETTARYLGTALYWIAASINIKPGHDYYFYIRSVNTVGKSAFVEAVGQASDDAEGYLDFFKGKITESHLGKELLEKVDLTEDNASRLDEFSKEWKDANDKWNAMWGVKIEQTKDGKHYVAGIGLSMEDTEEGKLSQFLVAANRIAFIDPANGNETPMFVAQGNQIFMNDVFLKRLTAPTITSGGNPPAFSLTPDGKLTAKNADISGNVNANSGTLNNVTINENCQIKGKLSANQIEGDIVKTVSKSFPRTNSYASGTITVRISDDQKFDRQVMIPPVLFRGGKHENFNSNNQQSYWYSTCRLRVTRNGQEIFNQSTTDAQGVFSSVIDMPAGQGTLTLTFTVSSSGANNWTPTTSISDLLVVVMKKSTAGISIS
ncbi:phage tail tip protein [Escherichia coli]|uniref:phage tail tip domain-containing protein n=1 Tax=Escherichia coli TaxID=562 RepID=UPI003C30CE1E